MKHGYLDLAKDESIGTKQKAYVEPQGPSSTLAQDAAIPGPRAPLDKRGGAGELQPGGLDGLGWLFR